MAATLIFVFGSNLAGCHGKGAALHARQHYGAVYGIGKGRTGDAYAIPTKDAQLCSLPVSQIRAYVAEFIAYAAANPHLIFEVTKIGCGLAGNSEDQIKPLFNVAPPNCRLPKGW